MSLCRVISYVVRNGCLLRPVCSLGKTLVSLCPASFYIPRPNLPGTPGVSWLPTFAFQSPMIKRISFSWYYLYKVLYLFIEPFNLSFSTISGWGIDLHYCDIEWFALKTNRDHSVAFEIAPKYQFIETLTQSLERFLQADFFSFFFFFFKWKRLYLGREGAEKRGHVYKLISPFCSKI